MQNSEETLRWIEEQHEKLKVDLERANRSAFTHTPESSESDKRSIKSISQSFERKDRPYEFIEMFNKYSQLQKEIEVEKHKITSNQIEIQRGAREFQEKMSKQEREFRDQMEEDINELVKQHNRYIIHASKLFSEDKNLQEKVTDVLVDYNSLIETLHHVKDEEQRLILQLAILKLRISLNSLVGTSSALELKQIKSFQDSLLKLKSKQIQQKETSQIDTHNKMDRIVREIASIRGNDDHSSLERARLKLQLEKIKLDEVVRSSRSLNTEDITDLINSVKEETFYETRIDEVSKYEKRLKDLTEENKQLLSKLKLKSSEVVHYISDPSKTLSDILSSWSIVIQKITTLQAGLWTSKDKALAERWLEIGSICSNMEDFKPEILSFLSDRNNYMNDSLKPSLETQLSPPPEIKNQLDKNNSSIEHEKRRVVVREEKRMTESVLPIEDEDQEMTDKKAPREFVISRETIEELDSIDRLRLKDLINHSNLSQEERRRLELELA